eukprot:symbB.v1.2.003410.t2/scaffold185.1/size279819/5
MAFAASGHESWQRPEADPPSLGIFLVFSCIHRTPNFKHVLKDGASSSCHLRGCAVKHPLCIILTMLIKKYEACYMIYMELKLFFVISILVLKVGILGSRSTLDQLAGCLGDPNANTVEGSFNALNKICEDGMMLIKQTWDYPDQETQHFVSWSAENLLPKVMQFPKHRFCS